MFEVPAIIAYPVGVFGIAVGAAAYLWYRQPAFAVKYLMKLFLYTSGLRPNYVRAGKYIYCYAERGRQTPDKSTILFVHGFSASKDQWVPIVQKLPRDLHIVVIDLPGHGDTTIPDPGDKVKLKNMVEYVHQFVEAIGLNKEPFHLVGTSLGGAIAGCYAADYPSELCKLTVICPALRTPVKTDFLKEVDAGHCRLIPDTADSLKSMLNSCVYHPIKASDQFFEGAIQLRLHKNPFYHRLFYALNNDPEGEEEALAKMSQIEAPTQLIWGKHDQLIHVSGVDLLKERLKHLETSEVYERCGHSVAMDRPGQLVKSLLVFRGEYKPKEQ